MTGPEPDPDDEIIANLPTLPDGQDDPTEAIDEPPEEPTDYSGPLPESPSE